MGKTLIAVAIIVVGIILTVGVSTLWIGGEFAASWSNRLMRMRVLAQFIAIIVIMTVLYFSSQH